MHLLQYAKCCLSKLSLKFLKTETWGSSKTRKHGNSILSLFEAFVFAFANIVIVLLFCVCKFRFIFLGGGQRLLDFSHAL